MSKLYYDLDRYVHVHSAYPNGGLDAQITIINAATGDGSHYYSAWGKSCFSVGVGSYGQCSLTTNPSVALFFSDRSKGNQPFSIDQMEQLVVSLDTVNNRIVSKSITSNNESVYTNVRRMGNFIYAESPGSLLIINLHKWTGKMSEHYCDRP